MTPQAIQQVLGATWPPAQIWREGAFAFRDGAGGGKRVSAASCEGDWTAADLSRLERLADPLVLIRSTDLDLDKALDLRGWTLVDPVLVYAAPVTKLTAELPGLSAFPHWPPLAIAQSIWAEGGIGPSRLQVMHRALGAKTALLARAEDRPTGVAFVACHADTAMLHALEVRADCRRKGIGSTLVHAAANWAAAQGMDWLTLAVTEQNAAARALYTRIGMEVVGHYHYRMK
jgi:GNAT superfamily N-acetyltransferase